MEAKKIEDYHSLILQGNRGIGVALAKAGLVTDTQLNQAYTKIIEDIKNRAYDRICLTRYLVYELELLKEDDILKQSPFSLIDMDGLWLNHPKTFGFDMDLCIATWTLPFDKKRNVLFAATACYLSQPILDYWQSLTKDYIIWYATSTRGMVGALQKTQKIAVKSI